MRRRRTVPLTTRKHLARAERERLQRRWIIAGTLVVLAVVGGLIGYGWLQDSVLEPRQPVAIVDGEEISTSHFQARVRLARLGLYSQAQEAENLRSMFGDDPTIGAMIDQQIASIENQLADPASLGLNTLETMVDEVLIRQEASRRGIVVSQDEIAQEVEQDFGFYRHGTPTPLPTSTRSPVTPTGAAPAAATPGSTPTASPSATAGPSPTATLTTTPLPTPTEYTLQAYQEAYASRREFFEQIGVNEAAFLSQYEAMLYRDHLLQSLEADVPMDWEQVHARHILLADEQAAQAARQRLEAGEDWEALAAELSQDESNRETGGDLGWFPQGLGLMLAEFEEAAFATPIGEVSSPVQTSAGWHLIQVLDKEVRPLSSGQYQQALQAKLDEILEQQRQDGSVVLRDYWIERVPTDPDLNSLLAAQ